MTSSTPPPDDPRARLLVAFAAGQEIFREGRPGAEMFIIEDGEVEISRLHGASEKRLSTLGPGDFFGEMAIVGEGRRNATVTAASPVELIVLFGTEFRSLEEEHPDAAERIRQKLAERLERAGR